MSTPICHRTLGPYTNGGGSPYTENQTWSAWGQNSEGYECLGSTCALWVPEDVAVKDADGHHVPDPDGDGWLYGPGDIGRCADNLRRRPWRDPQAPALDGGEE